MDAGAHSRQSAYIPATVNALPRATAARTLPGARLYAHLMFPPSEQFFQPSESTSARCCCHFSTVETQNPRHALRRPAMNAKGLIFHGLAANPSSVFMVILPEPRMKLSSPVPKMRQSSIGNSRERPARLPLPGISTLDSRAITTS
jgi:hypothetical protein